MEALEAALTVLGKGEMSLERVSSRFGIPTSTLHDYLKGLRSKKCAGRPPILTRELERETALTCIILQELGFPLTRDYVGRVVSQYLSDKLISNPFPDGVSGECWWKAGIFETLANAV